MNGVGGVRGGSLPDAAATEALGARLAKVLQPGDLVLLEGPLGAGKTTLVRGLVAALGGDPLEVCSPTFVLLESYAVSGGAIVRVAPRRSLPPARAGGARRSTRSVWATRSTTRRRSPPSSGRSRGSWLGGLARRVCRVRLDYEGDTRDARVEWSGLAL